MSLDYVLGTMTATTYNDWENCYRLLHTSKLLEMFNWVALEHSPICEEKTEFQRQTRRKAGSLLARTSSLQRLFLHFEEV